MADNAPPPNTQALIDAAKGFKQGPARMYIFGGANYDVNVGANTTLQGKGLINFEGKVQMRSAPRPSKGIEFAKALGFDTKEIFAALKKVNDAGAVTQASVDSIAGSGGLPRGFSGGGGPDIGGNGVA